MNRKQALSAVLFLTIFVGILVPLTYMIRTNGTIKDIFTGFYAEPDNTIDVIMIGSSPVYPGYAAPKMWGEYGFTAYPLSSNVQRPKAAVYLVKEALKTQKPELFVFEVRQFTAKEEYMTEQMAYTRGVTDNLKYSLNRIEMINALVSEKEERYTYYFDIIKYHSNWETIILPDQYGSFCYERLHPMKGYDMNDNVVPGEAVDVSTVTGTEAIPEEQEQTLRQLLSYLQENDLNALFFLSPKTMTEQEQRMYHYIGDIVEEYGFTFLNLNDHYEEIGIDFATDFYDGGSHTNASGAEKCTAYLGAYIHENYRLADKRGNETYRTWDAAYEYWKICQAEALHTIRDKVARQAYDAVEGQ